MTLITRFCLFSNEYQATFSILFCAPVMLEYVIASTAFTLALLLFMGFNSYVLGLTFPSSSICFKAGKLLTLSIIIGGCLGTAFSALLACALFVFILSRVLLSFSLFFLVLFIALRAHTESAESSVSSSFNFYCGSLYFSLRL